MRSPRNPTANSASHSGPPPVSEQPPVAGAELEPVLAAGLPEVAELLDEDPVVAPLVEPELPVVLELLELEPEVPVLEELVLPLVLELPSVGGSGSSRTSISAPLP